MPSDIQLRAVNGQELNVTGEVHLQVVVGDCKVNHANINLQPKK